MTFAMLLINHSSVVTLTFAHNVKNFVNYLSICAFNF